MMKELSEEVIVIDFDDLIYLDIPFDKKVGLVVFFNDVKYEFLLNIKKYSNQLLILGSGALGYRDFDRSRPFINRFSWDFDCSTIFYNDPTYYIDDCIRAGWCIGTEDDYYLEKIAIILNIIFNKLNISNENILFYGSSAGGFTSLQLSVLFKNSIALADIPQLYVYLFKSKKESLDSWRDVKEICFSPMSDEDFINNFGYRLSFIEMIKKMNYVPNAYIILDCSVEKDFNTQYLPFFKDLTNLPFNNVFNRIKLIIDGKNKGHAPISKNETLNFINKILFNSSLKNMEKNYNINLLLNEDIEKNNASYYLAKSLCDKYKTARFDFIIDNDEKSSVEIIKCSDSSFESSFPNWFNNNGNQGLIVTSNKCSLNFEIKCLNDGILNIALRSRNVRDKNKKSFPIYIDYLKFKINNNDYINENKLVWHNKPYRLKKMVKKDEILKISAEWLPFNSHSEYNY